MSRPRSAIIPYVPAAAASLLLFLLKAAFLASTPVRRLGMTQWILDDSFIVMNVARNVARGHGFSFDGTHATTGVSPLWTYLTSFPHLLLGSDGAVHATVILSAAFGALSAFAVFVIARRLTGDRRIAWTAFAFASLWAVPFFNAMNGMETSFFTLWVLLCVGGFLGVGRTARMGSLAWGALIGLGAGLALLTRADAIFLIATLYAGYACRWFVAARAQRGTVLREVMGMTLTLGACFVALLAWQMVQSGSPFPDNQIGRRGIAMEKHGFSMAAFSLPRYAAIVAWNAFQLEALVALGMTSSVVALLALLHGLVAKPLRAFCALTAVYVLLFTLALVAYQWYFPDLHGLRYLNPAFHLLAIALAAMLWALPEAGRWKPVGIGLTCAVMIALSWYRFTDAVRGYRWAAGMDVFAQSTREQGAVFWSAIDYVRKFVPKDAVIAARDHGRLSYFTDHPVQDLAGILDPAVIAHRDDGTLGAYLKERGVRYAFLPDPRPGAKDIYQAVHESLTVLQVPDAPAQDQTGFRLYQVVR